MTDVAAPRRRRWPYIAAALLLALGVAAALGWHQRAFVAERAAHVALAAAGLGDLEFDVAEIGRDSARLADIRFGRDGPRARSAEATFAPGEAAKGRLRTLRLIEPELTLAETPEGGLAIQGLPEGGDAATPPEGAAGADATTAYPAMPDVGEIEIVDGLVRLRRGGLDAVASVNGRIRRTEPGRYAADLSIEAVDAEGRDATLDVAAAEIRYSPDAAAFAGPVRLRFDDPDADARAVLSAWIEAEASPGGEIEAEAIVMSGEGRLGDAAAFADARGRIGATLGPDGEISARAELNVVDIAAPPAEATLAAVVADLQHGAASLTVDAIGPSGHVTLAADLPQTRDRLALSASGEVDAAILTHFVPRAAATGRVRFDAAATAPADALLAGPDLRRVAGAAQLIVETPELAIEGLAPEGSARGQVDLEFRDGALNVTSPGLVVGGVRIPPEGLAALPPDIRRALAEPAFVRLGGPGLADTAVTVSERPAGGFAARGRIGLGLSNPNLAIFLEGDAAVETNAVGLVEHLESDQLVLRLVDAALGPARVSGRVALEGFSGSAERFAADASLSLSANVESDGLAVERVEIDLSGPVAADTGYVRLTPEPGGSIAIGGYAGPLLATREPIRLTLAADGDRHVVYDRVQDALEAELDFRGFETAAAFSSGGVESPLDLSLDRLSVEVGPAGTTVAFADAALRLPEYGIAVTGIDASIGFGGDRPRRGELRIARIAHVGERPLTRPLSLALDVVGRGETLVFEGAMIAAGDRARLTVAGEHDLATGLGEVRLGLGPMVFAPGVLQPQDFVPPLHNVLLETLGEAEIAARVAWGPDGLRAEAAELDLAVDKLRTSEITLERLTTDFRLDRLFPPRTARPQRVRFGRLNVGVPMDLGVLDVSIVSPERVEVEIERLELFGGVVQSQEIVFDPTQATFEAVLEVEGIDLASILAFAEFGELQATGELEGRIPLRYDDGELRIDGGILRTAAGGGRLKYRPRAIDEALKEADRSAKLAIQALANFTYEEISIRINELEGEELRLDIFIKGKSEDVFGGVPMEFNIVIEGPIRQIIQENMAPPELPPAIQDMIDRGEAVNVERDAEAPTRFEVQPGQ